MNILQTKLYKLIPNQNNKLKWKNLTKQQQDLLRQLYSLSTESFNTSWFVVIGILIYTIFQFVFEYFHRIEHSKLEQHLQFQFQKQKQWKDLFVIEANKQANIQQKQNVNQILQKLNNQVNQIEQNFEQEIDSLSSEFIHTFGETDDLDLLFEQITTFLKNKNIVDLSQDQNQTSKDFDLDDVLDSDNAMNEKQMKELSHTERIRRILNYTQQLKKELTIASELAKNIQNVDDFRKKNEFKLELDLHNSRVTTLFMLINMAVVTATTIYTGSWYWIMITHIICQSLGVYRALVPELVKWWSNLEWPSWFSKSKAK